MKQVMTLTLAAALCISLCACVCIPGRSSVDKYAKVTFSDGTTVTYEVDEIPDLIHENVVAYNNKYPGNKVEVVDTVRSISSGYGEYGYISVDTNGGWHVSLKADHPILIDLREGTAVKIKGTLQKQTWSIEEDEITIIDQDA